MCAVAGLICLKRDCKEEEHYPIVRKMCDLQSHRGPDDDGIISLGNVCLGSNRLSIIDLTKAGQMPMSNENDEWWIVYNGETYNFNELREELIKCGHIFRSKTDTEVVPHLIEEYIKKGLSLVKAVHKTVKRLEGSYAIAVISSLEPDKIICAKNESPLVLGIGKNAIYCSSDISAFLSLTNKTIILENEEIAVLYFNNY